MLVRAAGDGIIRSHEAGVEKRVRAGRGREDLSVPKTDDAYVVVGRRDADRGNSDAGDQYLANGGHRVAAVGRAIELVRSEVKRVRRARSKGHRRIEEDRIGDIDSVRDRERGAVAGERRIVRESAAAELPGVLAGQTHSKIRPVE